MKLKPKVTFDTNIFISAILFGGNPRQCLELAREGVIELVVSKAILLELAGKMGNKFLWEEAAVESLIEGIAGFAKIIIPEEQLDIIKEENADNRILECAISAKADFIVSGDKKHLLSLKKFRGIEIISARQFLEVFNK